MARFLFALVALFLVLACAMSVPASAEGADRSLRSLAVSNSVDGDDCDGDGLPDEEERALGTDPCKPDSDADGLTDFQEVRTLRTDPLRADTDADGLGDEAEVLHHQTDPLHADTDGDGLDDREELAMWRSDPNALDTDADGLPDGEEVRIYGTRADAADSDGDGLGDAVELAEARTDPRNADTDNDGLHDADEIQRTHTEPTIPDTDGDGLSDGVEALQALTDPRSADTDADSVADGADRCPLSKGVPARRGCPKAPSVGESVAFPGIGFSRRGDAVDTVSAESYRTLVALRAFLTQCEGLSAIVEGHAMREGTDQRNRDVSDAMARAVAGWLMQHGVERNAIEATLGYGARRSARGDVRSRSDAGGRSSDDAQRDDGRRVVLRVAATCAD